MTLRRLMAEEGLLPYTWSNDPGDVYAMHRHDCDKVIFVVQGSIHIDLPDADRSQVLEAGDRLDLPARIAHSAEVGTEGVVCLEGHRSR